MKRERITAWVTRYALSSGIEKVDAEVCSDVSTTMIKYGERGYAYCREWHLSEEEAIARAEEMRAAKIKSLKARIQKLKKLSFRAKAEGRK